MFFAPRVSNKRENTGKHHLVDAFRPLRDWEKSCTSNSGNNNSNNNNNNNNNNNKRQQQQLQQQQQQQQQHQQQQQKHRTLWSECCPPDLNHKDYPKIYQIECQKELQKFSEIKCECQIACQKICRQKMSLGGDHSKQVICSGFQKLT